MKGLDIRPREQALWGTCFIGAMPFSSPSSSPGDCSPKRNHQVQTQISAHRSDGTRSQHTHMTTSSPAILPAERPGSICDPTTLPALARISLSSSLSLLFRIGRMLQHFTFLVISLLCLPWLGFKFFPSRGGPSEFMSPRLLQLSCQSPIAIWFLVPKSVSVP